MTILSKQDPPHGEPRGRVLLSALAEAVVEAVRESLLVLDVEHRVIAANRSFFRTFQVGRAETIGRPLAEIGNGQWSIPALRTLLETVLAQDVAFEDFEVVHDFPRLGPRAMYLNARRLDAADDHPALILLAIEDVTDRRAAEQRALAYAKELERSNRALQEFAAVASHDLQEPLRKIRTFAERLRERCNASLDERGTGFLAALIEAAKRMQVLIDDVLSYARVSTSARTFRPVDLDMVVRGVLRDLQAQIDQAGGRIELGPLPSVQGETGQLRQLFQNLIANAIKFRRPGTAPVVTVSARRVDEPDPAWELSVEDNGIGFNPRYAAKIFELFERLHGRSEYEGTGMGLAIARRIAEHHGGTIAAAGEPGRGARFTVSLPIQRPTSLLPFQQGTADVRIRAADHDPDGRRRR